MTKILYIPSGRIIHNMIGNNLWEPVITTQGYSSFETLIELYVEKIIDGHPYTEWVEYNGLILPIAREDFEIIDD